MINPVGWGFESLRARFLILPPSLAVRGGLWLGLAPRRRVFVL